MADECNDLSPYELARLERIKRNEQHLFPYGWCLPNFLGEDADAVSWDYGMNEGNGAAGLESYVRQALQMPKSPPMFILLDMKPRYVNMGFLSDPVAKRINTNGLLDIIFTTFFA